MYQIVLLKHQDGERLPLLVDKRGFPVVEPNLFALNQRGLAWRTIKKKLKFISLLYKWANHNAIDLDDRIERSILFTEDEINGSLFSFCRKSDGRGKVVRLAVSAKTTNAILLSINEYLKWRFSKVLSATPSTNLSFSAIQQKQQIISKWLMNSRLSTSLAQSVIKKNLSDDNQKLLIDVVNPKSETNPWKNESIKQRNFLIVILLLYFGLRPSELLTLKVNDIVFGSISSITVYRRPHDKADPRIDSPEVKRSGRILTILDFSIAKIINTYITDWRSEFDDRHKTGTDYLILSQEGDPLTYVSISKIFDQIRQSDSRFPKNLTAKTMRHCFSTNLEKQMRMNGIKEEDRKKILKLLRGDISDDSQKVYIDEAIIEEARYILTKYISNLLNKNNNL